MPDILIHPNLVLLTTPDKASLSMIESRCREAGVQFRTFLEADMDNQPTALATEPINGQGRKLFADMRLFEGV